jgi:hypothetical protein
MENISIGRAGFNEPQGLEMDNVEEEREMLKGKMTRRKGCRGNRYVV